MSYPKIKFRVSAKKDFDTLLAFIKDAQHGDRRVLDWAIFKKYPELEQFFDKKMNLPTKNKLIVRQFINTTYKTNEKSFVAAMLQHQKHWEKIAPKFFTLTDSLFTGHPWPKGKYLAWGTIWSMYPRFLNDKTFQIPYAGRQAQAVPIIIAHEMLHFMFYDYFAKNYPKHKNIFGNMTVWHTSEIFNVLVQNSPTWVKIFKQKSESYPEHKKIIARLSHLTRQPANLNAKLLIDKIYANY